VEPVAAYDVVAGEFERLSAVRQRYLDQVEAVIASRIARGSRSLLDVGAGDGKRSARIARACGIERLVQLEPSAAMRERCAGGSEVWPMRAEELESVQQEFDVIVCLWNVLGHVAPASARRNVFRQFARLLGADGSLFIDVNHRYNALQYGFFRTAGRFLHDVFRPSERNGDVVARWRVGEAECRTYGHVFTAGEMQGMARGAGLRVARRFVIDYSSGEIHRCRYLGNLLYEFRRA
jgi:2-polyprenyl-3-methyl-5-hydroxy-6-metoxy-1,4-benzoquinol methylase